MNNTSLILLFEIGNKKLLFPADAQWENWQYALSTPALRDQLVGVDLYKVGHHGSLNATPHSLWDILTGAAGPGPAAVAGGAGVSPARTAAADAASTARVASVALEQAAGVVTDRAGGSHDAQGLDVALAQAVVAASEDARDKANAALAASREARDKAAAAAAGAPPGGGGPAPAGGGDNPLISLLSTHIGHHGSVENNSEVPRRTLVQALEEGSTVFRTDDEEVGGWLDVELLC